MEDEITESAAENTSAPVETQVSDTGQEPRQVAGDPQEVPERLERVEVALGMLLDHLQTLTEGTQILETEHSRSTLASIALDFSAVAHLAVIGKFFQKNGDVQPVAAGEFLPLHAASLRSGCSGQL